MQEVLAVMAATKKKVKTGFCNNIGKVAQCEGTKPVDWRGNPMPICEFWETCACPCHTQITEMYKMADLPREPPSQPKEWTERQEAAHLVTTAMLASVGRDVLSTRALVNARRDTEGPAAGTGDTATGTPAAPLKPVFTPTPTGRRAKGQLEFDVLQVCDEFTKNVYDWSQCTPRLVAEEIGRRYAIEPPSTGPINAVWDRWEKLGFAEQAKKPSRFTGFKIDGSIETLEMLKIQAKRARRLGQGEAKRGSLRPRAR